MATPLSQKSIELVRDLIHLKLKSAIKKREGEPMKGLTEEVVNMAVYEREILYLELYEKLVRKKLIRQAIILGVVWIVGLLIVATVQEYLSLWYRLTIAVFHCLLGIGMYMFLLAESRILKEMLAWQVVAIVRAFVLEYLEEHVEIDKRIAKRQGLVLFTE